MDDREFAGQRRRFLKAGAVLSLATLAGCSTSKVLTPEPGQGSDQTDATLGLINALRAQKGLEPLVGDAAARGAALDQATRMARAGKMQHNIGLGATFYDRMKGQDVSLPAAENIAVGQDDAARAFDAWVRSPKHLVNMLAPNYRGLGVAVVTNPASGNRPYWAMVLSAG
ncbi:CAP domain-containing protein [Pararhizobium antarcticum]|uniref:Secretion protein n=1 Tax=Pararhizobium antarcticum TaxID=1798805 RepID=A0A657LXY3_9HYPH|nr:CAP domain-containing protein [Pararhizobium antarcticum]OJF98497.1 secretion protein [Rhizobium sp. 58]OJG00971.1 secretion protein [Pararhizobium antarcticum]